MIDLFHPSRKALLAKWPQVQAFESISPWTTGSELAWLAEAASRCEQVGEVGSYKGKSARALFLGCKGRVFCSDRFQDGTEPDFRNNLSAEFQSGRLHLFPLESAEAAKVIATTHECPMFDLFFIDASHEKHDVLRDIEIWRPLVKPGGIIAFHDCFPGEVDNGISQALEEVFPDYHLAIDSIAAVRI